MLQMDGIGVDYTGFTYLQIEIGFESISFYFYFRKKGAIGVRDTGWLKEMK